MNKPVQAAPRIKLSILVQNNIINMMRVADIKASKRHYLIQNDSGDILGFDSRLVDWNTLSLEDLKALQCADIRSPSLDEMLLENADRIDREKIEFVLTLDTDNFGYLEKSAKFEYWDFTLAALLTKHVPDYYGLKNVLGHFETDYQMHIILPKYPNLALAVLDSGYSERANNNAEKWLEVLSTYRKYIDKSKINWTTVGALAHLAQKNSIAVIKIKKEGK
jgi:hypothetical protein